MTFSRLGRPKRFFTRACNSSQRHQWLSHRGLDFLVLSASTLLLAGLSQSITQAVIHP
jgi:hypothetical protein